MCEPFSDFSVIGEHEYTCRALVQTAYWEYSCAAVLEQVHDSLVCMRIACSGDISLRFVHYDIYLLFTADSLTVETDIVCEDIDLGTEFRDDFSVHSDHAGLYVLVCFTT